MTLGTMALAALIAWGTAAPALSERQAPLPRRGDTPPETHAGLETVYDTVTARDGTRLRAIVTRPAGATGRLPAILFLSWLSCDTVEVRAAREDGWGRMLRRVARESGVVFMRVDKRGVGDSEGGPCSALDYETEQGDHLDALAHLRGHDFVDPSRIVIFGASMGATHAPLVAARPDGIVGLIVWGGGTKTWFERTLGFERRHRQLTQDDAVAVDRHVKEVTALLHEYLVRGRAAADLRSDPDLARTWAALVGVEGDLHYGRPAAFHQQAQRQDWAAAWSRVDVPVLVLYGEYDWFEDAESHQTIADIVNRRRPGAARFRIVPKMDHHFSLFPTREAAARERGVVGEGPVIEEILSWLRTVVR